MRTGLPELLAYLRRTTRAPVTPRLADEAAWYTEHTALFISTLKWTILGAGAGACVGFGTRGFLWSLSASAQLVAAHTPRGFAPYWLLPVALPVGVWLIRTFAKEAHGHGTEAVIAAVHQRSGRIDWPVAPIKLGATVLTVTFGGSVGKEGPAAQIGAALTSLFADLLHLSDADRRRLVICGISAGFAAVFGTPISGALFGIEVLYLGVLDYSVIFPAVVAGIVGHLTCGTAPPFPVLPDTLATTGFPTAILVSLGSGALFGLIALLLIESMRSLHVRLRQFQAYPYRIAVIGGIALALLYRVTGDQYSGLGTDTINGILAGTSTVVWSAFLIKILATSITLETGGSGGIVTPIFFIGAASGAALAPFFGVPPALLAAFGFVSVLAGAANTPLAATVMAIELLPQTEGVYAALAAVTAFVVVGHRSVYASQMLGLAKSAGLDVALGGQIGDFDRAAVKIRKGSLTERLHTMLGPKVRDPDPPDGH